MGAGGRDFASFLDREASVPSHGEWPEPEPAAPPPSMPFGIVGEPARGAVAADTGAGFAAAAYLDVAARLAEEEPPPETTPEAIARELALGRIRHPRDLDRLRRDFAFRNHPDRVRPEWRERAMIRMQIANRMIDEAKRMTGF